ncbi:MAG TPA: serine O-acetyltransferase [Spirochaetia bacterium]|nr:serine O-acetyltransferase [Spirochaetia bacterium]HBI36338.1 serine O-acetyltransferase [Spirochaetia bacterium]
MRDKKSIFARSFSKNELQLLFLETIEKSDDIKKSIIEDLNAIRQRDPASRNYLNPFLNYKGFHALESYRVTHLLWKNNLVNSASLLQSLISEKFGVDIHPAATIGNRIFIDHATSIVIGETAVVGNDVSMLHEVTLGGTGKETGDRHPKIGNGVLIGAGAKILGNIKIGDGVKIGAGSVVLSDVAPHTTVVGIPAKIVGKPKTNSPSFEMDQSIEN